MAELPRAAVERLIRKAGATRVSDTAVDELIDILEDISEDISTQAIKLAHHAKRKTVTGEDIKMAARG
ncbi:MAG: histone family protein [Candidatus Diapherotrites archaeon]|nr:histone family protein [Candidatus Diapherotrites archaeon]